MDAVQLFVNGLLHKPLNSTPMQTSELTALVEKFLNHLIQSSPKSFEVLKIKYIPLFCECVARSPALLSDKGPIDALVYGSLLSSGATDEQASWAQLVLEAFLEISSKIRTHAWRLIEGLHKDATEERRSDVRVDIAKEFLDSIRELDGELSKEELEEVAADAEPQEEDEMIPEPVQRPDLVEKTEEASKSVVVEEEIPDSDSVSTEVGASGQTSVSTVAGQRRSGYKDGPIVQSLFDSPSDVVICQGGSMLFLAEHGSQRIRRIETKAKRVMTAAGTGGYGYVDGPGRTSRFSFPHGLAVSPDEQSLFIVDTNSHSLRRLDLNTFYVTTVAGLKHQRGHVGGTLNSCKMCEPRGICVDLDGNLYVTDSTGILHLNIATKSASNVSGIENEKGFRDGTITQAIWNQPDGIVLIDQNTLLVADTYNHRIRQIDLANQVVTTFAGTGECGYHNGSVRRAKFKYPQKLAYDPTGGRVFVSELNDCIRYIDLNERTVGTLAGSGKAGYQDGPGTNTQFSFPYGIAWDGRSGTLYVADSDNHCVRKVSVPPPRHVKLKESFAEDQEILSARSSPEVNRLAEPSVYIDKFRKGLTRLKNETKAALALVTSNVLKSLVSFSHPPDIIDPLMKAICVILHENPPSSWSESRALLAKPDFKDRLSHANVENLTSAEAISLRKHLTRVQRSDLKNLPEVRPLITWVIAFEKSAHYCNEHSTLMSTPLFASPRRKKQTPHHILSQSSPSTHTKTPTGRKAQSFPSEPKASPAPANEEQELAEGTGEYIDPAAEMSVGGSSLGSRRDATREIVRLEGEKAALEEQNRTLRDRMKELQEQTSLLIRILEQLLGDDAMAGLMKGELGSRIDL